MNIKKTQPTNIYLTYTDMAPSTKQAKNTKPLPDVLPTGVGEVKSAVTCLLKSFSIRISPTMKPQYVLGMVTTLKLLLDKLIDLKRIDKSCLNNVSKISEENRDLQEKLIAETNSEEDKDILMAMLEIESLCKEESPSIDHLTEVITSMRLYNALVKRKVTAETLYSEETSEKKTDFRKLTEEEKEQYRRRAKEINFEKGLVVYPVKPTTPKKTSKKEESSEETKEDNVASSEEEDVEEREIDLESSTKRVDELKKAAERMSKSKGT